MSLNEPEPGALQPISATQRARMMSATLSDAARRARFSVRSRRRLQAGGFHARRADRLFRAAAWISFFLVVVLPTTVSALYFGLIASDQYVAEFKFTVAGSEPPTLDPIGAMTGLPNISVIQDTQIVANHLTSRAAVEALNKESNLREIYSRSNIDWWSRFNPEKPIEKLVRYWNAMTDVSIKMPAGIVEAKIRAFDPQDALKVSHAVLKVSEDLINELNDRMNKDTLVSAEQELTIAKTRLAKARRELETARNEEGLLSIQRSADGVNELQNESKRALLKLQQDYNAQIVSVSEQAPQMQALRSRIAATKAQIAELEAKVTRNPAAASLTEASLSALMTRFAELDLEKQVSERLYESAIATLETARVTAERKSIYLRPFVQPTLPEDAVYPRRILNMLLTAFGSLAAWAVLLGGTNLIRNHMA